MTAPAADPDQSTRADGVLTDAVLLLDTRIVLVSLLRRLRMHHSYRTATHRLNTAFCDVLPATLAAEAAAEAAAAAAAAGGGGGGAAPYDCRTAPPSSYDCTICMEEIALVGKQLPCGHVFHLACLRAWLQQSGAESFTCPNCRKPILVAPEGAGGDARRRQGSGWRLLRAVDGAFTRLVLFLEPLIIACVLRCLGAAGGGSGVEDRLAAWLGRIEGRRRARRATTADQAPREGYGESPGPSQRTRAAAAAGQRARTAAAAARGRGPYGDRYGGGPDDGDDDGECHTTDEDDSGGGPGNDRRGYVLLSGGGAAFLDSDMDSDWDLDQDPGAQELGSRRASEAEDGEEEEGGAGRGQAAMPSYSWLWRPRLARPLGPTTYAKAPRPARVLPQQQQNTRRRPTPPTPPTITTTPPASKEQEQAGGRRAQRGGSAAGPGPSSAAAAAAVAGVATRGRRLQPPAVAPEVPSYSGDVLPQQAAAVALRVGRSMSAALQSSWAAGFASAGAVAGAPEDDEDNPEVSSRRRPERSGRGARGAPGPTRQGG
ncbi:E3 ubiquitin protein ligase RIN2 [Tetrabaena socialis]|uniref:E3 ubiquitin protein ligase RIN2 n=1 Tax=Tetrabaena socialis TaxID=47790 RepID=A0A2J8AC02_9CHLO|nr:E3 ubiquitin protein ligase RIN2 [Tetrabaena socialis]|eukprot:PNH10052.1 E3 ubiquitin protein ligase RIN2 [Tetrabaena socialis]